MKKSLIPKKDLLKVAYYDKKMKQEEEEAAKEGNLFEKIN
jgi:hypothetical protein